MRTKFVGEIGSNWSGIDDIYYSCEKLIELGATPKLQLWKTDKTVNKKRGPRMYDSMKRYELSEDWVRKINTRFPSTFYSVFDVDSVAFLEESVHPDMYKIASPDCIFEPLLTAVALTNKPVYVSVGGATLEEIRKCAKFFDWRNLTLMACVVAYPCPDAELLYLRDRILGSRLIQWGYSSHSMSKLVPACAVALGATAIECHFKISNSLSTPDSGHSFTPIEFSEIMDNVKEIEGNLGNSERPLECEAVNLALGRRKADGRR